MGFSNDRLLHHCPSTLQRSWGFPPRGRWREVAGGWRRRGRRSGNSAWICNRSRRETAAFLFFFFLLCVCLLELRWFLSPCRDSWCQEGSGRVRTGLLGRDARLWEELRASQLAGLGLVLGTFTEHLLSARPCGHSRKAGRPGPALMGCTCRDILCPPLTAHPTK